MGTAELPALKIGLASAAAGEGCTAASAASQHHPPPLPAARSPAPTPRQARPGSAAATPAAKPGPATEAQVQLAAGPYLLLFSSPGAEPAQLVVNLMCPQHSKARPAKAS